MDRIVLTDKRNISTAFLEVNSMIDTSCNTCICTRCLHNTKYGFHQCFDCRDCYEGNNHCEECSMFEEDDDEE